LPATDPTQRFSNRAEYYSKSRPRYPRALLDFCNANLGLKPEHSIADIGSGTGLLTELFLENGNPVFAVEPNQPMRLEAEKTLACFSNFHSVNATAESTTLPDHSIDFVIAGQAFHWFDRPRAKAEFQRILRLRGQVFLIWNEREKEEDPFSAAYDSVVREFQTDWHKVRHENLTGSDPRALAEFFASSSFQLQAFDNPQSLDLDGLIARAFLILSSFARGERLRRNACPPARNLRALFAKWAGDSAVHDKVVSWFAELNV
jgi:SAM-dependent methyltransferase